VSVLSGLARSDVDPWHEAAKLAQLLRESCHTGTCRANRSVARRSSIATGLANDCRQSDCAFAEYCSLRERNEAFAILNNLRKADDPSMVSLRRIYVLLAGHTVADSKSSSPGKAKRWGMSAMSAQPPPHAANERDASEGGRRRTSAYRNAGSITFNRFARTCRPVIADFS
jgi:hypothetical protein